MDGYLRQSTASQSRLIGPFVDDTDFKTAETGLTIANTDIKLRANGTTLSNKNSGGGTHQANGMYSVTWDATDSANVGELKYSVVVSGALAVFGSYWVLEEAVYDALFAASAPGYLQPTVAGRTLDVATTGEAGVDFGNVASPKVSIVSLGYSGDVDPGDVIDIKFASLVNKVLTTLGGTPAVSIYKDNSTTQDTDGVTLSADFDGVTGLNNLRVDLAADTTFYSAGSNFFAVLTTGTIGGVSAVGLVIGQFSINARSPLRPTTPGTTLDVTAGGTAGVNLGNVENQGTTLALTGTTVKTATDVESRVSNLQGRVPTTLINSRMDSYVGEQPSNIKRNQALAKYPFVMIDADTKEPKLGALSITCVRSLDGAASGAGTLANISAHPDADGKRMVDFGAGDLDAKIIVLTATATGCLPTYERIITTP